MFDRKIYKYLNTDIDISLIDGSFFDELYWKGKLLVFTEHFSEEFDKFRKPLEFVLDILNEGEHFLISRKKNKYNVFYPYQKDYICMSYAIHENVVCIHIKPIKNKLTLRK